FFGMPMALFPAIAQSLGGPTVLGLLYAAPAAGSFVFSATSGWTSRIHRHGMGVVVAAVIWGLAIIGFGFAPGLWPALYFLALAGAADMMSGVFRSVDRKSTRLNSSHVKISYAVFCMKKEKQSLHSCYSGCLAATRARP